MKFMLFVVSVVSVVVQVSAHAQEFQPIFAAGKVVFVPKSLLRSAHILRIHAFGDEGSRSVYDPDYRAYDFEDDFKNAAVLNEVRADMYVVEDIDVRSDLKGMSVRKISKRYIDPITDRVRGYEIDGKIVLATDVAPRANRRFVDTQSLESVIRAGHPAVTYFSAGTLLNLLADQSQAGRAFARKLIDAMNSSGTPPPAQFLKFQQSLGVKQAAQINSPDMHHGGLDEKGIFHPIFNMGRMVFVEKMWPMADKLFRLTSATGEGSRHVFDQDYQEYDFQDDFHGAVALNEKSVSYYVTSEIKFRPDLSGLLIHRITRAFTHPFSRLVVGYEMDGKYVLASDVKKMGALMTDMHALFNQIHLTKGTVRLTDEARFSLVTDSSDAGKSDLARLASMTTVSGGKCADLIGL